MALSKTEIQSCTSARRRLGSLDETDAAEATSWGKYKGVRFRADRKSWVAEMKPFKYKNKISFGDFKSREEAARAVDAAFFYYDKNKWRNFRDSPTFLKPLPVPLSEEAKLKFVKEQARALASWALRLPSTFEPANRCEERKITSPRTPPIEPASDHCGMPATSMCNSNDKDRFEAIQDKVLVSLRSCVVESESSCIQPFEATVRSETPDLVDDGDSLIQTLTKTLCAADAPTLETFPEIPDVDESLFCEESRPLDVNDYAIDELHSLVGEQCSVPGSVFTLQ